MTINIFDNFTNQEVLEIINLYINKTKEGYTIRTVYSDHLNVVSFEKDNKWIIYNFKRKEFYIPNMSISRVDQYFKTFEEALKHLDNDN